MGRSAEDWQRLKHVFEAAYALPAESRTAYLTATCHDNPALRFEVQQLLASHELASTFLERPLTLVDESNEATIVAGVPVRIGR